MPTPATMAQTDRFWSKVDMLAPGGCWLWTASTQTAGYGVIGEGNAVRLAHRVAYEYLIGAIEFDLTVDHLCRVRRCVNPAHMEIVTRAENGRRSEVNERRRAVTHCPRGHEYDRIWAGRRRCSECNRIRGRKQRAS